MTEVLLGPPGTGKTTALLGVLDEELAAGTRPDRVGFVSFTRRAAQEAVVRAGEKFGFSPDDLPYFRTLHSLAFRQGGLRAGEVLDGDRLVELSHYAGVRLTGRRPEDGSMAGYEPGDRALHLDQVARARRRPLRAVYDEDPDGLSWSLVDYVARALHQYKVVNGYLDYTDMLERFLATPGAAPKLDLLLVDEAQDLSLLQWEVVRKLADGVRRVVIAGDDDQAIYTWAGADVATLVDLPGTVRVLGDSHRVPPAVQPLALELASRVGRRRPKTWRPRSGVGRVERASRFADADLSGKDVLVLARNTYVLRAIVEPALHALGVVYERRGRPSIDAALLAAVTTWERLRAGAAATIGEVRRVYAYMTSGRGVARGMKELSGRDDAEVVGLGDLLATGGLQTTEIWHEALDRLPREEMAYVLAARLSGERLTARPRVRLSTIHGSKGAEAEHVILMRDMARRSYRELDRAPEDEARVWYVAVTRAKERLTIVDSRSATACPWI